jgi:FkbM family methyltransferase
MIEDLIMVLKKDNYTPLVIYDVGARDCLQSVEFSQMYPHAKIYAFECNPMTLPLCRENIKGHTIELVPLAVNSYNGTCTFYPIDPTKTITTWKDGNPGASSLFLSNGTYTVEQYVQNKSTVPCQRLDAILDAPDIIWMDLQGAELLALESLGSNLDNVQYIYTEVSHRPIYTGQVMFCELHEFLVNRGFYTDQKINSLCWQEDIIYRRVNH